DACNRSRVVNGLRGGGKSVWRQQKQSRNQPVYRFDSCAQSEHGRAQVVLSANPPRRLGLRFGRSADSVRHGGSGPKSQGPRGGEQEWIPIHLGPCNWTGPSLE